MQTKAKHQQHTKQKCKKLANKIMAQNEKDDMQRTCRPVDVLQVKPIPNATDRQSEQAYKQTTAR